MADEMANGSNWHFVCLFVYYYYYLLGVIYGLLYCCLFETNKYIKSNKAFCFCGCFQLFAVVLFFSRSSWICFTKTRRQIPEPFKAS